MFPKVGDIVRLNPDFLKVWFKEGNEYFGEEVWNEKYTVTEIRKNPIDEIFVKFKSKDYKYGLYILSNGELSSWYKEFKDIQVFIPADIEENKNYIYCSCNGPKKENWVFGERFYVCTKCKKEVI